MPGIKGLWSLRPSSNTVFDKFLVQSYIGETRVLSIEGEEMGEVRISFIMNAVLIATSYNCR
jgi:DNA damage-binding protein 1